MEHFMPQCFLDLRDIPKPFPNKGNVLLVRYAGNHKPGINSAQIPSRFQQLYGNGRFKWLNKLINFLDKQADW